MDGANRKADPMTLNYMKYLRLMLLSVGSWPGDVVEDRPRKVPYYTIYLLLETTVLLTGELLFIYNRVLPFFDLGDLIITISLTVLLWYRAALGLVKRYGEIFKEFITKFHLMHFRHKSAYSEQIYHKTNQVSHYFTVFMMGLSLSGVISFNITPLYQNYRAGLFLHERPENISPVFSIHYEYSGFKQEEHYFVASFANVFLSYICAFVICTMDLALCLMVFQIIGHIHTLIHTLRNFPKPKKMKELQGYRQRNGNGCIMVEMTTHFDDEENKMINKIIIECIKYHLFIVSFTQSISNFFGSALALNYLYHLVGLSLLFIECMQGKDSIIRYGPLTLMTLTQLAQFSITFEVVGSESEKIKDEVYFVPWESMSVSNQKSMALLLQRVQTPVRVTAMGMTPVGVQTMGAILKTTFSYCTFLKSLNP